MISRTCNHAQKLIQISWLKNQGVARTPQTSTIENFATIAILSGTIVSSLFTKQYNKLDKYCVLLISTLLELDKFIWIFFPSEGLFGILLIFLPYLLCIVFSFAFYVQFLVQYSMLKHDYIDLSTFSVLYIFKILLA